MKETETWIINPFAIKLEKMGDDNEDKDHLIEMQACQSMKLFYDFISLAHSKIFWCSVQIEYSTLAKKVLKALVSFASSIGCVNWDFYFCIT